MAISTDGGGKITRLPVESGQRAPKGPAYLPQNMEAEASFLGTALYEPEYVIESCADVLPRHFYGEANRLIMEAVCGLRDSSEPIDPITVSDWLMQRNKLELVGGEDYLFSLRSRVLTSANARYYANIIKRTAQHRTAIQLAGDLAAAGYNDEDGALASCWLGMRMQMDEEMADAQRASGLYLMSDLEAESLQPSRGILGDILYEETVAFMYGPPGRWKSFVALSWALAIGSGRAWMGREVTEGDVVYVAAEGARGIGKRIRAWKRRHGLDGQRTRVRVLGVPIQLLQPESVASLLAVIKAADITPTLIVIDTLARSMAGADENAAKDANSAIDAAAQIKTAFGCCVLLVHHPGKDAAKGLRGSSALLANADTVISVAGQEDGTKKRLEPGDVITVASEKPKDSEPFADIYLTAEKETWATDDGQFISSLVIVPTMPPEPDERPQPRTTARTGADALQILARLEHGMTWSQWRLAAGPLGDDKNRFNYLIRSLVNSNQAIEGIADGHKVYYPSSDTG